MRSRFFPFCTHFDRAGRSPRGSPPPHFARALKKGKVDAIKRGKRGKKRQIECEVGPVGEPYPRQRGRRGAARRAEGAEGAATGRAGGVVSRLIFLYPRRAPFVPLAATRRTALQRPWCPPTASPTPPQRATCRASRAGRATSTGVESGRNGGAEKAGKWIKSAIHECENI